MVKSRRSASAAKSRPKRTVAWRPSVSTSWRSVVVSIGRPSTTMVNVPCATPVGITCSPAFLARAMAFSGVSVVARSRSPGRPPQARSRTAPPTSRVSSPGASSAAKARASGPAATDCDRRGGRRRCRGRRSLEMSLDNHAVDDMRRDVFSVGARSEEFEKNEPGKRRGETDEGQHRQPAARPMFDRQRIAQRAGRDRARTARTARRNSARVSSAARPITRTAFRKGCAIFLRSRPRYTAPRAAWRSTFAAAPAIRARAIDDWPGPSGRRAASRKRLRLRRR